MSSSDINFGYGINEWSQADIIKLLNHGYESSQDFNSSNETIYVNNSLYWNSQSGNCYTFDNSNYEVVATECDFTNTGLSDEVKEYIIDQVLYLGGFDNGEKFVNQAYVLERGSNVYQNPSDGITRTLTWTGKVGLIYPSDFGYATDLNNCNIILSSMSCTSFNWLSSSNAQWLITPYSYRPYQSYATFDGEGGSYNTFSAAEIRPTLTLNPSLLFDDTTDGSLEHPYKIVD